MATLRRIASIIASCWVGLGAADLSIYALRPVTTQSANATVTWKLRADCGSCAPNPVEYQIQWLDALRTVLKDTGRVSGVHPPLTPVVGPESARVASYRVRVRYVLAGDADSGAHRWSAWAAAHWRRAPGIHSSSWGAASWICTSPEATDVRSSMLWAEFSLPSGRTPVTAVVHIIGLGQFQVRVNGADVGGDANVPGWTTWAKRLFFSTYELPAGTLAAFPAAK